MPWKRLNAAIVMMRRLDALDQLRAAEVALIPHYSGTKNDPHAGSRARDRILNAWRRQAMGPQPGEDDQGRTVVRSAAELRNWLGAQKVYTDEVRRDLAAPRGVVQEPTNLRQWLAQSLSG